MYGTVAKIRVKAGMGAQLEALSQRMAESEMQIPGYIAQYVYRMDADPDELYLTVLFESREAYHANAASPDQAARYAELAALMAAPPEWHDGEVIFAHPPRG
jgi:quinol monooxygenase YgiN